MKKISKYLKISTFAFVLAMMCFVSVSAGTLAFTEATPILQGWKVEIGILGTQLLL